MSELRRLVWRIRGSAVGGVGLWSNRNPRTTLEAEAIKLTKMFPDLEFEVEEYREDSG